MVVAFPDHAPWASVGGPRPSPAEAMHFLTRRSVSVYPEFTRAYISDWGRGNRVRRFAFHREGYWPSSPPRQFSSSSCRRSQGRFGESEELERRTLK